MNPTKNGLVNAAMYLASMFPMLCVGYFSEYLIEKEYLARTTARKTFVSIACFGSAACVALVPTAKCDQVRRRRRSSSSSCSPHHSPPHPQTLVISLLLLGSVFQAFDAAGNIPNPGDLSKNFPTTVFALVNMLNTSAGFIVPFLIGHILEWGSDEPLLQTWSIVFYLAAGISVCGAIIYICFGSGERQDFDKDSSSHQQDDEEAADLLSDEDDDEDMTNRLLENSPVRRLNAS